MGKMMDYSWVIRDLIDGQYNLVLKPNDGHERSYIVKTGTKEEIIKYLQDIDWTIA